MAGLLLETQSLTNTDLQLQYLGTETGQWTQGSRRQGSSPQAHTKQYPRQCTITLLIGQQVFGGETVPKCNKPGEASRRSGSLESQNVVILLANIC